MFPSLPFCPDTTRKRDRCRRCRSPVCRQAFSQEAENSYREHDTCQDGRSFPSLPYRPGTTHRRDHWNKRCLSQQHRPATSLKPANKRIEVGTDQAWYLFRKWLCHLCTTHRHGRCQRYLSQGCRQVFWQRVKNTNEVADKRLGWSLSPQ